MDSTLNVLYAFLNWHVKQIYHVKALPGANQDLDLNRAENEVYPPEKLRMTLERFYTSVVVGLIELFRHVGRLQSWREPVRTAVFCSVSHSSSFAHGDC